MKKILLSILLSMLFLSANAFNLKGGVVEEYIPQGFFGSWGVISKLNSSNNPAAFNFESRDVWTLSGAGNKLILQNLQSGAYSEIIIKEKSKKNTLKFARTKTVNKNGQKIVYHETVSFELLGNNFSGTDKFVVEKYDGVKLVEKNEATYIIAGVRISGQNP